MQISFPKPILNPFAHLSKLMRLTSPPTRYETIILPKYTLTSPSIINDPRKQGVPQSVDLTPYVHAVDLTGK